MKTKEKLTGREWKLIWLCTLVYFFSYSTRYNFKAAVSVIVNALGSTSAAVGLAVTASAITYGAGQVICGIIGDRIPPRWMVSIGLCGAAACNLCMTFLESVPVICVVWGINGFFQAMIWPPLVRIMTENLSPAGYKTGAMFNSYACSCSTVFTYLAVVPGCLQFFTWREAFLFPALTVVIMAGFWFFGVRDYKDGIAKKDEKKEDRAAAAGMWRALLFAGIPFVILAVILQGMLRDGVLTWMPDFLSGTYGLGDAMSIMSTAILPAFSVLCVFITGKLLDRIGSEIKTALLFWILATVAAIALRFLYNAGVVVAIACLALLNGSMHGINHVLTARIAPHFARYHRVSTIAGILNACTYVGEAVSVYGFAVINENAGWNFTLVSWAVISFLGVVMMAICLPCFTRYRKEEEAAPKEAVPAEPETAE